MIESYCFPKRIDEYCEFQLGKRDLYPHLGGTLNQKAYHENDVGNRKRLFSFENKVELTGAHLDAFHWLMHLSDGKNSNFDIAEKSNTPIKIINESIEIFYQKNLLHLK